MDDGGNYQTGNHSLTWDQVLILVMGFLSYETSKNISALIADS